MIHILTKTEWEGVRISRTDELTPYQYTKEYAEFVLARSAIVVFFEQVNKAGVQANGFVHTVPTRFGLLLTLPRSICTTNLFTSANYNELIEWLIMQAKKLNCIAIKFNTDLELTSELLKPLQLTTSKQYIALENTLVLDLQDNVEVLYKQFNSTTKRKLKQAQSFLDEGVLTTSTSVLFSKEMYDMYQTSGVRKQFTGLPFEYIKQEIKAFDHNTFIVTVSHSNTVLSWGIFFIHGTTCSYRHGANLANNTYPSAFLVQWLAIQEAKKRGCRWYDMMGATPLNSASNHPWNGITQFKLGFGTQFKRYEPTHEVVLNPVAYTLYKTTTHLKKQLGHWSRPFLRNR
jgi:lipid II:glycine glycyltransferase (peptidoglycan interpeptide bridge formation enzyme)